MRLEDREGGQGPVPGKRESGLDGHVQVHEYCVCVSGSGRE